MRFKSKSTEASKVSSECMSLNHFDIPQLFFTPLVPVEEYWLVIQWVSRLPIGQQGNSLKQSYLNEFLVQIH